MPANENPVPEDSRHLRQFLPTSPLESPVTPPLADVSGIPLPETWPEDMHSKLDIVGQSLADIEVTALMNLEEKTQTVQSCIEGCRSALLGSIGLKADKVEAICKRIADKIKTNIGRTAEGVYERLAQVGLPYQSLQDVRYALVSGDTFGTVGQGMSEGEDSQGINSGQMGQTLPTDTRGINGTVFGNSGDTGNTEAIKWSPSPGGGTGEETTPLPSQPIPPVTGGSPPIICPPECIPVLTPEGIWLCKRPDGTLCLGTNIPISTPPTSPTPPTIPTRPIPPGIPSYPTPTMPNPETCEYPSSPAQVIGCGSTPPPPPPPEKYWLEAWCEGCGWQWCVWRGHSPPTGIPSGHILFGPFSDVPNADAILTEACKTTTAPPDEDEDEDEDEEPGEEPGEDESPGDDEDEEEDDEEKPPPDDCIPGQLFVRDGKAEVCPGRPEPETGRNCKKLEDAAERAGQRPKWLDDVKKGVEELPFAGETLAKLLQTFEDIAVESAQDADCDKAKIAAPVLVRGLLRFIDKYTGLVPKQALTDIENISNYICQSSFPMPGEADVALSRGDISEEEWICFQKAAGRFIDPAKKIFRASRAKPDPSQIDRLFRRKFFQEPTYRRLMREAGVIEDEDRQNIHDLNEFMPTGHDAIRMMNKDVSDDVNVDWSETDKTFKDKYKGKVKDWFDANGMTEETARYFYRAARNIPSFTMGQQFLFRFERGDDPSGLKFDKADFLNMLIQDDWHPGFAKFMIESSYHVPTRIDLRRAYQIYAIEDEQLKTGLLRLGYAPDDAEFYKNYWKKLRQISDTKAAGYPTLRTLSQQFARCEISEDMFRDTLAKIVTNEEQEKEALKAAKLSRDVWQRQQSIKSVRQPYIRGALDDNEAISLLHDAGLQGECVDSLVSQWSLLRLRQDKEIAASKLCSLRWYGIIDYRQHVEQLSRLGFSEESAMLIAAECTAYISEKASKAAARAAEKAQAEIRRKQKENERLARQALCGPPSCPSNTPGGQKPKPAGQKNQGPLTNGTGPKNLPE